ncbi:MAG TPA: polyamine ABC transporter substrate-binding protein [Steroidobacteraceae bacterium]|nr:polyamine ABC transporter substrate-binding protein [Steroidobacteraceae bacterium]
MTRFIRSSFPLAVVLLALGACGKKEEAASTAAAPPPPEEKVLHIYNWSDYIAPDTVANFEKETGIKVTYDTFDSNEVLETKLLAGHTGYDVVVPSANFLERQIKAGVFLKLDKSKLPNFKNMDPDIMARIAKHDPGNQYATDWQWGTTGLGYNVAKVKAALGDVKPDSWALLLDPANAKKLQKCGITMLDAPSEVVDSVLIFLGKDPNSESLDDLKAAEAVLMKVRPYVKYFHSSSYIDDLANGEVCLSLGWSGDVFIAKGRAEEAKKNIELEYYIPKEGAIMWFDTLAIPADAPHPGNAHLFLDYTMRPEVIAAVTNFVTYANGNLASLPFVDEAVKNNPNIYPTPEMRNKLYPHMSESQEYSRQLNRAWTTIKTGQ